jgi:hypothetical protein
MTLGPALQAKNWFFTRVANFVTVTAQQRSAVGLRPRKNDDHGRRESQLSGICAKDIEGGSPIPLKFTQILILNLRRVTLLLRNDSIS